MMAKIMSFFASGTPCPTGILPAPLPVAEQAGETGALIVLDDGRKMPEERHVFIAAEPEQGNENQPEGDDGQKVFQFCPGDE
jgi:hypothetical protein